MEILNEKDMEYFRKLQNQGDAIIWEISSKMLAILNLEQLKKGKGKIDQEEVKMWLQHNQSWIEGEYRKTEKLKEENEKIADWLNTHIENANKDLQEMSAKNPSLHHDEIGMDGNKMITLIERLATIHLGEAQWKVIQEAFDMHMTSGQIMPFLREDLTPDEMRQIRHWIVEVAEVNPSNT